MKQQLGQGLRSIEKRTRGNSLRKLGGIIIRRFAPGFGAWDWYVGRHRCLSKVNLLGRPMYLDLRDKGLAGPLYEFGAHEPAETDLLAKASSPE